MVQDSNSFVEQNTVLSMIFIIGVIFSAKQATFLTGYIKEEKWIKEGKVMTCRNGIEKCFSVSPINLPYNSAIIMDEMQKNDKIILQYVWIMAN